MRIMRHVPPYPQADSARWSQACAPASRAWPFGHYARLRSKTSYDVVGILAVVYRQAGGRQKLEMRYRHVRALFKKSDFPALVSTSTRPHVAQRAALWDSHSAISALIPQDGRGTFSAVTATRAPAGAR